MLELVFFGITFAFIVMVRNCNSHRTSLSIGTHPQIVGPLCLDYVDFPFSCVEKIHERAVMGICQSFHVQSLCTRLEKRELTFPILNSYSRDKV